MKKLLISLITFILLFSCTSKSQGLKKSDIPPLIYRFLHQHVKYHKLDDKISERIYTNFIKSLDFGKYFFYQSDMDSFAKHKNLLDNYINNNKEDLYTFIDEIFSIYKLRFNEGMARYNKIINKKFDFTRDEKIFVDREKIKYAQNEFEMKERWRKNIKLQLLNYISSGKKIKKAKDKLNKKYSLMQKRTNEITKINLLEKFLNSFAMSLDSHSNYLTQSEHDDFSISMQLKLEGIGVRLRSEDGFVIVDAIIPGGATDKLPKNIILKPNDKIISVAQKDGEPVDVIDLALKDVVKIIRGKKGTEVRLTVIREIEKEKKIKTIRMIVPIIREEIKLKDSDAESDIFILKKNKRKVKIGYIKLPSFYVDPASGKSASIDVDEHIAILKKKNINGMILDLRGNPGGSLNEAIKTSGLFIHDGPVLQVLGKNNIPEIYNDYNKSISYDGPLIILIDKFSASASEILAGAIKDHKRGIIIGSGNSFGKGTVQSYSPLNGKKGAIKITTGIFYQPSGNSNQLYGIEPNIIIPSLTSIWDIGEDKTTFPLKWKKIKNAIYATYGNVNKRFVQKLKMHSTARVKKSTKFQEMIKKIARFKKQLSNKTINLKEEANFEKQKEKELKKTLEKKKDTKIIDTKNDIFLKESFNIMGEYINILSRNKLKHTRK
jgi:carboxyl-terminal processing protease